MNYQDYDILYKADGDVERVCPENDTDYQLNELQRFVGGYVEFCYGDDGRMLVVDEEGKLKGKQINERATQWYRTHVYRNDYIVGDALLCKKERVK